MRAKSAAKAYRQLVEKLEDRRMLTSTVPLSGPGSFDSVFGTGGTLVVPVPATGPVFDDVEAMAPLSNGQFLTAGFLNLAAVNNSVGSYVRRLNASGTVDTAFGPAAGVNGTSGYTFISNGTAVSTLKLDASGRILVGISSVGIVRLNANGVIDSTFGTSGFAAVSGLDEFTINGSGQIFATAGQNTSSKVVRLTPNGIVDTSFATSGSAPVSIGFAGTSVGGNQFRYRASGPIAIESDGKIIVGGSSNYTFSVQRLNVDGSMDSAFGTSSVAQYPDFYQGGATGDNGVDTTLNVLPSGVILAAGYESQYQNFGLNNYFSRAVEFTTTGQIDVADFAQAGSVGVGLNGYGSTTRSIVTNSFVQPDGKLIFAGTYFSTAGSEYGFFAQRYLGAGSPDSTFGVGGIEQNTLPTPPGYSGVAQADLLASTVTTNGDLVAAGPFYPNPSHSGYAMAAYTLGQISTPAPVQLSGTPIGTPGSYGNLGNTIDKVFDGNVTTFFDPPTGDLTDWVGLDLGTPQVITLIKFAPRIGFESRMGNGQFQASSTADFSSDVHTLYQTGYTPAPGQLNTINVNSGTAFRYVRYTGGNNWVSIAEMQVFGPPSNGPTIFSGTPIGTSAVWSANSTVNKVFDGNLSTFFDPADGSLTNWAGLDLESAKTINQISYAPCAGYEYRMFGGQFQVSSTADFSSDVHTIYNINSIPAAGQLTTVIVAPAGAYRYVRYTGGTQWVNIAEMVVAGAAGAPTPHALSGTAIGTPGGWTPSSTITAASDGNVNTYFDPSTGDLTNWVGLDLGAIHQITQVSYAPRTGYAFRMVGAQIQVSSTADFSSDVHTLYTINAIPVDGQLTTVSVTGGSYRYIRYVGGNQWVNIAELQVSGY